MSAPTRPSRTTMLSMMDAVNVGQLSSPPSRSSMTTGREIIGRGRADTVPRHAEQPAQRTQCKAKGGKDQAASFFASTASARLSSLPCASQRGSTTPKTDVVRVVLDTGTVGHDQAGRAGSREVGARERREAPLLRHDDLLSSGELRCQRVGRQRRTHLVASAAQGLHRDRRVGVLAADAEQDLANVDPGDEAVRLAPGAAHAGLQAIGTRAGQHLRGQRRSRQRIAHLVDAHDVERVDTDTEVERVLAGRLHDILRGSDAIDVATDAPCSQ